MILHHAIQSDYTIRTDTIAVAADGGTLCFQLCDADGEIHEVFIDRRINTSTRDHLYAVAYPDKANTVWYGYDSRLVDTINSILTGNDSE